MGPALKHWVVVLGLLAGLVLLVSPARGEISRFWLLPGDYDLIKLDLSTPQAKFVALTFDDGPDSQYTPLILDILQNYQVRASFFLLGERVRKNPQLVKRMVDEGHVVGSHSTQHVALTRLSPEERRSQLEETNQLLASLGIRVEWFRPPFGAYDRSLVDLAHSLGMRTVLWTVDPQDWRQEVKPEEIVRRVMGRVENGSVILLHAINPRTVTALPEIINALRGLGFRLVTMDEWALLMSRKLKLEELAKSRGIPPSKRPHLPAPVKSQPVPTTRPKQTPTPPPPMAEPPGGALSPSPPIPPAKTSKATPPYLTLGELALVGIKGSYQVYQSPPRVWRLFWPNYRPIPAQKGKADNRAIVVEGASPSAPSIASKGAKPAAPMTKPEPPNYSRPHFFLLTRKEIEAQTLTKLKPVPVSPIDTTSPNYQDRIAIGKPVLLPKEVSLERLIELIEQGKEEIFLDGLSGVPELDQHQRLALYLSATHYYDPAPEMPKKLRLPSACRVARFSAPREAVLAVICSQPAQWKVPAAATHLRRLGLAPVGLSWKEHLVAGQVMKLDLHKPLVLGFAW